MRNRQLYASVAATSNGVTFFDIPSNTTIRALNFAVTNTGMSAGDTLNLEISLNSSGTHTTNDALGVIGVASYGNSGAGSPASVTTYNGSTFLTVNCPVRAGERIYLNSLEVGSGTWAVRCLVWFD